MIKALSGDVEAQYQLGIVYLNQRDFSKTLKWLNEAASKDHTGALLCLGRLYLEGPENFAPDKAKGLELLNKASELNDPEACFSLADYYLLGQVVEQDVHKAQLLFAKAATVGGMWEAARDLGCFYYTGAHSFEIDHKKAIQWYKEAYRLGDYKSAVFLSGIYSGAYDPDDADPKKAKYWNQVVIQLLDEGKLDDEDFN